MQAAHLARDGAHDDDSFGVGLACDGESILVGASRETTDVGESTGAVYVYSGADFSFQQRLVASEAAEWDTERVVDGRDRRQLERLCRLCGPPHKRHYADRFVMRSSGAISQSCSWVERVGGAHNGRALQRGDEAVG